MLAGMPVTRPRLLATALTLAAAVSTSSAGRAATDPVAAEIERWTAFVKTHRASDEIWKQVKEGSETTLQRAADALRRGRRLLALQRLAYARADLLAAVYMGERPAEQRKDGAAFEAEWARMRTVLADALSPAAPDALAGVEPAAVRALAEAALPQVRVFCDASLDYGRNTMPDSGLYYLGSAQAQRDFVTFTRRLSEPSPLPAPPLRPLAAEIEALQAEMLALYRPPVSIDKHPQFIAASSLLKEARELDAASLRHGALFRYLMAAYRFAPLRTTPPALGAGELAEELARLQARLSPGSVDHSLGRLFLELAQAEAESPTGAANAAAVALDVLPRYFAALQPAPPRSPPAPPLIHITLVRWPYT
jgi:hypothetical protein